MEQNEEHLEANISIYLAHQTGQYVVSASSSRRCLHNYFNAMLCLLKSVNGTCYVYVGAIIFYGPFWLMVSKGLLSYAFSRILPCLVLPC